MSITDELREWANDALMRLSAHEELLTIADHIDAEHEAMLVDARKTVYQGYIELPKDADGVPIRIGDELEFSAFEIEKPVTRMVDGIGQGVFFAWCGERGYQQHEAKRYRHHHEPTVEDVLEELLREYDRDDSELTNGEIIERFAAKLRLRGDAE